MPVEPIAPPLRAVVPAVEPVEPEAVEPEPVDPVDPVAEPVVPDAPVDPVAEPLRLPELMPLIEPLSCPVTSTWWLTCLLSSASVIPIKENRVVEPSAEVGLPCAIFAFVRTKFAAAVLPPEAVLPAVPEPLMPVALFCCTQPVTVTL